MISEAEIHAILKESIRLWNGSEFFACHDKLEEAWQKVKHEKKKEKASDPRRDFLHGLILFAAGGVHWQRGNPVGVRRKFEEALRLLRDYPDGYLGVRWAPVAEAAREVMARPPERIGAASMPALTLVNAKPSGAARP